MRTLLLVWISVMTGSAAFSEESRSVVVAATHSGRIEILESDSLKPVGSVAVNHEIESISASPDGRRLYVAQESETTGGCCGLFSLDLATRQMCLLTAPALFGAPSRDGRYLFTQPGSDGIAVFDAKLLTPLPRIKAPGTYSLHPSPDGQWLLGVTNTPAPSVDIFDIARGELARRIALPSGPVMGAWVGNWFYVYSHDEGSGKLWRMDHRTTELPPAKPVHLPDLHGDCTQNLLLMMTGGNHHLFIAEAFGYRLDRRRACAQQTRGGIYVIDPQSGAVQDYMQGGLYVNRMAAARDGNDLFVLESTGPDEQEVRLLKLNPDTGHVLASRDLQSGVWNIALANIPAALLPHGRSRVYTPEGGGTCRR